MFPTCILIQNIEEFHKSVKLGLLSETYFEPVFDVIYKQKSEWNCDDYKYFYTFHHGANLENTLKCLHYEKYLSPDEQEKPLDINGTIELKKLDYLNIEIFVSR